MSELFQMLRNEGLATPFQAIVLVIDAYLIVTGIDNASGFMFVLVILIASTLVLQSVRGRFLLLNPQNAFVARATAAIDTYTLRAMIIVAIFFAVVALYLGVVAPQIPWLMRIDGFLSRPAVLLVLGSSLILAAPVIFWAISDRLNNGIAEKLKNCGPLINACWCPFCNRSFAIIIHEIKDRSHGQISLLCELCGRAERYNVPLNIGEVQLSQGR